MEFSSSSESVNYSLWAKRGPLPTPFFWISAVHIHSHVAHVASRLQQQSCVVVMDLWPAKHELMYGPLQKGFACPCASAKQNKTSQTMEGVISHVNNFDLNP